MISSVKIKFRFSRHLLAGILCAIVFNSNADVRLPGIFSDHMILQRDQAVTIWGWASAGEEVKVTLAGLTGTVKANRQGKWSVKLAALTASGPFVLVIEGDNKIIFSDVLIGDIWVCGGQSNMAWRIRQTGFNEADTAFLSKNNMRLFTVRMAMDYQPKDDVHGTGWQKLSRETLQEFSAVAYHFGKYIHQAVDVPVGLISVNLGATSVETWMSNEALLAFPQFDSEINPVVQSGKNFSELEADFEKQKQKFYKKYNQGAGIEQEWFKPDTDLREWKEIRVAGNTWESEPVLKDHDGAVWFRTTFDLPDQPQETMLIQLGQIDDYDIAWINGEKIGETYGKHNHRNYTVATSGLLKNGNVLVVRVFDTGGIGGFTTSPFWAGPFLSGRWIYRKGDSMDRDFKGPQLPNATPFSSPGVLFNGMIAPLTSFPIKGAIWYQGESNAGRAYEYRELFPALIGDWRKHWGQGDFPFLFVQLANYMQEPDEPRESSWAELREAQAMALVLPNTGMATAIDIGEADDIHPKNKREVGSRLARSAMKVAYGDHDIVGAGPTFKHMQIEGNQIRISFEPSASIPITRDKHGYIRGFQIAGQDKKFRWAQASLDGESVVVKNNLISQPVAVRYAWADNPGQLDLYNDDGLPALPFRTDQWQGITFDKVFVDGPRF